MSRTFPKTIGSVYRSRIAEYPLEISREYNLPRMETMLDVQTTVGARTYRRQVSFWSDTFTDQEQLQFANLMGQMINEEIPE